MRFPALSYFIAALLAPAVVHAQSSNSSTRAPATTPSPSPSPSPSLSLSLTTANVTVTTTTRTRNQNSQITTVLPTTFNVTYTLTPTTTSTAPSNTSTTSPTPTPAPIVLDTKLDPAFGVLGAILIITGLPSAFWGHKNRWTSFFLIGFYTLSLVCIVLILKFGVLTAVNPPSKTLRGMFVLASAIAGFAGGGIAIFFWKAARFCIGAWGGLAFGFWLQCFHNGGLIKAVGFRWILYMGCGVIGFVLCTIPKIHYHILLISTAFVGSSAFMLGVDCYTTAGLKEFYIWNLGFRSLFPKYSNNGIEFPVSQAMQIELGLIGATALMGIAVQLRILTVLQRKLREIAEEQKKRDEEAEVHASDRFAAIAREQDEWEKEHPTLSKHGRLENDFSKDQDGGSPTFAERRSSTFTLVNDGRPRYQSGVSDLKLSPPSDEDSSRRATTSLQNPGVLPALDLGLGIQEDVPRGFIARQEKDMSAGELEEIKRKEELMAEIQTIRRSIEALKSETPAPSSSAESRRPSMTSRRTLSIDASSALLPVTSHLRPPRATDPRARVQSLEMSNMSLIGESISRPTSVPSRPEDWDEYVHDRKLLQPPAGVTPPIATTAITPVPAPRMQIPRAVTDALKQRKERESALGFGRAGTESSDDVPLAKIAQHKRSSSAGGNIPVNILPPRKPVATPAPQKPMESRTRTFEELNERHREKMRGMQAPLTQAAKEDAELEIARQRWERAKALEKEAVTKRQMEKAAAQERKKEGKEGKKEDGDQRRRQSRAKSADRTGQRTSRRVSTLKVEDWQRGVPFPDNGQ